MFWIIFFFYSFANFVSYYFSSTFHGDMWLLHIHNKIPDCICTSYSRTPHFSPPKIGIWDIVWIWLPLQRTQMIGLQNSFQCTRHTQNRSYWCGIRICTLNSIACSTFYRRSRWCPDRTQIGNYNLEWDTKRCDLHCAPHTDSSWTPHASLEVRASWNSIAPLGPARSRSIRWDTSRWLVHFKLNFLRASGGTRSGRHACNPRWPLVLAPCWLNIWCNHFRWSWDSSWCLTLGCRLGTHWRSSFRPPLIWATILRIVSDNHRSWEFGLDCCCSYCGNWVWSWVDWERDWWHFICSKCPCRSNPDTCQSCQQVPLSWGDGEEFPYIRWCIPLSTWEIPLSYDEGQWHWVFGHPGAILIASSSDVY